MIGLLFEKFRLGSHGCRIFTPGLASSRHRFLCFVEIMLVRVVAVSTAAESGNASKLLTAESLTRVDVAGQGHEVLASCRRWASRFLRLNREGLLRVKGDLA